MIEDRIASTPASQSTISNYDVDVHSSRTDIPDSKIHPQLPPIEISEPITSADNSCSDNSCSDNSSIELVEENVDFFTAADELKNLILRNNITHVAATDILKYMNKFNVIGMQLPSDSRSFLSTPNSIAITTIGNGQLYYKGFRKCVLEKFADCSESIGIRPIFNMDGLPLHNSSKKEFWPILCSIDKMPELGVMVIAIFMGETKPVLNEYLGEFVSELKLVMETGITLPNEKKIAIYSPFFVCDSPARCHLKGNNSNSNITYDRKYFVIRYGILQFILWLYEMYSFWRVR